jgi:hypothetical protein
VLTVNANGRFWDGSDSMQATSPQSFMGRMAEFLAFLRMQVVQKPIEFTIPDMEEFSQRPPQTPPIASEKIAYERKIFFLDLKENQRGRFLKITEDVGGRRDTIMLPAEAFKDFLEAFQRLVEFEAKL